MAAQLSKVITDHMRACLFVLSSFLTEGAIIAETLTGLSLPNLEEGDVEPGYGPVIVSLSRNVKVSLDALVEADLRLSEAAAWESDLLDKHKETSEKLGFWIVALRRNVLGQYVAPKMESLGLQPVDVRDAITVSRRAVLIGERFAAPNLSDLLGEPLFEDPTDLGIYVRQVRELSAQVLDLVGQLNEARRVTARTRFEKNERLEEHKKTFLRSTRVFEDFCRLSGRDELAEQVRATVARSRPPEPESVDVPDDVVSEPIDETQA